jgi:hypothetical protein
VYSDRAVAAGDLPCVPATASDDWSDVSAKPSQIQRIEPGDAVTFELTGWSTREMPDWMLHTRVAERSDLSEADMRPQLSSATINNRLSVNLTLHAPSDAAPGTIGGLYVLSGPNFRPWAVGFVVQ